MTAVVVGGGLAGCEAAWALAERGVEVTLYEMRPAVRTPAHQTDRLAELKRVASEIEFIPVKTVADAVRMVEDADAILGFCTAEVVRAGKKLRWIQLTRAGVEKDLSSELIASNIVLTNTQRIYGPHVAGRRIACWGGFRGCPSWWSSGSFRSSADSRRCSPRATRTWRPSREWVRPGPRTSARGSGGCRRSTRLTATCRADGGVSITTRQRRDQFPS